MNIYLFLPPVIFIIFALAALLIMAKGRRVTVRVCICLFAFSAIVGFPLYTYSYLSTGSGPADTLYASLRGIYSIARMFSISDEWSHTADSQYAGWLTENIHWQILLWMCHASAIIVIQSALLSFFGRKLVESFRMRFGLHREVYIIKGCDKYALMLGENIATHDKPTGRIDPKRLIIFLIGEDDNEKEIREKVAHFNAIVKVLDRNCDLEYYLKKARIGRKTYVILMGQDASAVNDTLCIMDFANTAKIDHDNLAIYVFTATEWDREEIEAISKMKTKTATGMETSKYPYAIHILNESDILTRQMVVSRSPLEALKRKNAIADARATKDFTVMILGFGRTGQNALLHLVRGGQFLDSTMRAIIADIDIERLYGRFSKTHPALGLSCKIEEDTIFSVDVLSREFFDRIKGIDETVDYIVIALGNDTENKNAAIEINRHYIRSFGSVPVIAVSSQEEGSYGDAIFCFGRRGDVYSEAIAINEELDKWAKVLNSGYDRGQFKQRGSDDSIGWHELDWFSQESKRAQVDFMPYLLELACFNDGQKDIMANIGEILYRIDEHKKQKKDIEIEKDKALVKTLMDKLNLSEQFKETLAHTEHLRWNAFHVTMGYSPISIDEMHSRYERLGDKNKCRKDEVARLHICLVHWDELDEVYGEYLKINPGYKDFKEMDYDGVFNNIAKFLCVKRNADIMQNIKGQ